MTSIPQSPYTLVVCEKPDAARRIAHALGNSSLKEITGQPPVFSVTDRNNQQFVVCSAIGHCTDWWMLREIEVCIRCLMLGGLRS